MLCEFCKQRKECKEPCLFLQKELQKVTKYQRELPAGSTKDLEYIEGKIRRSKYGTRKSPKIYNDNWELDDSS